ncbi:AP-3 complex subunit mu-2, partial [Perkinsus olseni]
RCAGIVTAKRRHQKERTLGRKVKLIKKNLRKWNKKISKAEADEIERARKERAKYAGSQYESDSDPDNDLGDLPSDPDENEELKRLAGRILRVHLSSLNSYSRFGRRPQRKKPSSLGTTDQQSRSKPAASPKKKDQRSAPEKVLTTVMNASSEDAPWETVFMTEVADNKNLKESV